MSTAMPVPRDGDLACDPMVGMDQRQRSQILATLRNTSMFFKKITLVGKRSTTTINDDMHDSLYNARTNRISKLGKKAFNMSQPSFGAHFPSSPTSDNEDRSDVTHSEQHSSTSSQPTTTHTSAAPSAFAKHAPTYPPHTLRVDTAPQLSAPSGLPSIPERTAQSVVEGLPSATELPWTLNSQATNAISYTPSSPPSKPPPNQATTADNSVTKATVSPGNANAAEVQHNVSEDAPPQLTDSPVQTSPTNDIPSQPPSTPAARNFQSLPSRKLSSASLTASTSNATASVASPATSIASPSTSGERTPRALHPRLASLPPPMMARYTTQGSARLTPSIVTRPPPMPILNLPMLPPPTPPQPSSNAVQASPMRLRSMPALPHRGPSDMDGSMADHDNAELDEMDDLEEEDEDGEMMDGHSEGEPSPDSVEVEVPAMSMRLRSPLPPSISRGDRELPTIRTTSPFMVDFNERVRSQPQGSGSTATRETVYFTPGEVGTAHAGADQTPKLPAIEWTVATPMDYFNSKTQQWMSPPAVAAPQPGGSRPQKDPSRTPRPDDTPALTVPRTVPMPSPSSPRPMLTHHASKSMSDLLTLGKAEREKEQNAAAAEKRTSRAPDYALAIKGEHPEDVAGPSTLREAVATIRRQRSLPTFTNATEPPPYPTFSPFKSNGPPIVPREEEGKEKLPPYTNQIFLTAIMPRKMEFDAPGVQSRDRKWKRALFVLEGTTLKIYRIHAGVVNDWWERTVGVGDKTSLDAIPIGAAGAIRVSAIRETAREVNRDANERSPKVDTVQEEERPTNEGPSSRSGTGTMASIPSSRSRLSLLLHPRRGRDRSRDGLGSAQSSRSRLSVDALREEGRRSSAHSTISTSRSMDCPRPATRATSSEISSSRSLNSHQSSSTSTSPTINSQQSSSDTSSATSHFSHISPNHACPEQDPDPKDLVRQYTLQNAESGLASDYIKRKNVIRVRLEGEQFLLQAKDVPGVIDWIEGIQAATNIALDLDERPMPKGPMFPRRRRRRARRVDNPSTASTSAQTASSPLLPRES